MTRLEQAQRASQRATDQVWEAVERGDQAIVVDSPPGAGKSTLVREIARRLAIASGVQVLVISQTNNQADDLIAGFMDDVDQREAPVLHIGRLHSSNYRRREDLGVTPNVTFDSKFDKVAECDVLVSTASKVAYLKPDSSWRLVIIDEAYQMRSDALVDIGGRTPRLLLVGDPGQLEPFTTADTTYFRRQRVPLTADAASTILQTQPNATRFTLPVSWRLSMNSVDLVSHAFYSKPFQAVHTADTRLLNFPLTAVTRTEDAAVFRASRDGWAFVELPEALMPEVDHDLVASIVAAVRAALFNGATTTENGQTRPLTAADVAVGVSHNSQRLAVEAALNEMLESITDPLLREHAGLDDGAVTVQTANRLQGLEFAVVVVWHPLSGRRDASEFHLDAGRLCVLLSRHKHSCIVVARGGIGTQLRNQPRTDDVWVTELSPRVDGIQAHLRVLEELEQFHFDAEPVS